MSLNLNWNRSWPWSLAVLVLAAGCGPTVSDPATRSAAAASQEIGGQTQDEEGVEAGAAAKVTGSSQVDDATTVAVSESNGDEEFKNMDKIELKDSEWKQRLTEEQYYVTRKHGTERAFTGEYWDNKRDGIYKCVCCGQPLFDSSTKYESGTGWPSFFQPFEEDKVGTTKDNKLFYTRVEVHCSRCNAHLGHVFDDGPAPTGKRYCMNSAALKFEDRNAK